MATTAATVTPEHRPETTTEAFAAAIAVTGAVGHVALGIAAVTFLAAIVAAAV